MSLAEVQERTAQLRTELVQLRARFGLPTQATQATQTTDFGGVLGAAMAADPATTADPLASATTPAAPAGPTADDVISTARKYLGVPYVWGGEDPSGFDCSGLVQYVFGQNGISLPRVAADQARAGVAVTAAQAKPGDLVCFGQPVDHIGIYIGNGQMLVAPHTGANVRIQSVDLSTCTAIRRVLPDTPAVAPRAAAVAGDWSRSLPPAGQRFAPQIEAAARQAGIDPRLLASLVSAESGFDPSAVSPVGAVGLTQLMPGTAAGLGVTDPKDPAQNLMGGAKYLAAQLQKFGRADYALAAYNAGPSAVTKYGGIPPYAETQTYVQRVLDGYRAMGGTA